MTCHLYLLYTYYKTPDQIHTTLPTIIACMLKWLAPLKDMIVQSSYLYTLMSAMHVIVMVHIDTMVTANLGVSPGNKQNSHIKGYEYEIKFARVFY